MRKAAKLSVMSLVFFLLFLHSEAEATKIKWIRYSGKLIRVNLVANLPYFEYEEKNAFQTRRIFCDQETLTNLQEIQSKSASPLDVDGKASVSSEGKGNVICEGKPNVGRRFQVGVPEGTSAQSKFVAGQILEADPVTGQIVYSGAAGRRGYLTVSPEKAQEYRERLDRMETVEISGKYRYHRLKRYFVEE